jgi:hypothetical protein
VPSRHHGVAAILEWHRVCSQGKSKHRLRPLLNLFLEANRRGSFVKAFCPLASTLLIGTLCAGQPTNDPPETSPDLGPLPEGCFGKAHEAGSFIPANSNEA